MSDKPWFKEGLRRLAAGEKTCFSTGIDGRMTYGYGRLDKNGFWEFPVPFESLPLEQQKVVMDLEMEAEWP